MAADTRLLLETLLRANNSAMHLLLESVEHSQDLQEKSVAQEWIAKINPLLNSTKDRWLGVCLLGTLIKQCDTEIFLENCLPWLKTLARVLQQEKQNFNVCKYVSETFERILSFSVQFSELSREISSAIIPSLLTAMLNEKGSLCSEISLLVIKSCIQYYPGPCGSFWKRIEALLLEVINSENISLNQVACSCFTMLPKCGNSAGTGIDKQSASWELQWRKMLNTLSAVITELYSNHETASSVKTDSTALDLNPAPVIEPQRTETCLFRIKFILKCLDLMLSNGFTKSVNVPINATVTVLQRILAVNETSMRNQVAVESVLLKSTLPTIHVSVLNFLATFIESCRMNLLPYHQIFMKIFLTELSWSSSKWKTTGFQQRFSKLRSAVYECLQLWIHITGSIGEHSDTIKKIVCHLIDDVKPQIATTKMLAPPPSSKNIPQGKKAKRRRVQDDVSQLTRPQQKMDPSANVELCVSGLKALNLIISKTSNDLPPQTLKEVQVFVVTLLLQCQHVSTSCSIPQSSLPIPYESPECRKLLYHTLQSLLYYHNPSSPPPVQHAMKIFSQGIQDQSPEVSKFCAEAQMMCNILIHPRVAVLASPLSFVLQEPVSMPHNKLPEISINKRQETVGMDPVSESGIAFPIAAKSSQETNDNFSKDRTTTLNSNKDSGFPSTSTSLVREYSDSILQNKSVQDSNTEVFSNHDTEESHSIITTIPLQNAEGAQIGRKNQEPNEDFENPSDSNDKMSCENRNENIGQKSAVILSDSLNNTASGPDVVDDDENCPPVKKRRTSDINRNTMEIPVSLDSNNGGEFSEETYQDEGDTKATTESDEDERLAREMIATFVDSQPDSD